MSWCWWSFLADQRNAGHAPEKGRKTGRAVAVTLLLYAPGLREIIGAQCIPVRTVLRGKLSALAVLALL